MPEPAGQVRSQPPERDRLGPGRVPTGTGRLYSLDLLRAIASLIVFYVDLSWWFRAHGGPTSVTALVNRWVVTPMHLSQDFSFLGVALLFLISGFVISMVAMRETAAEFAIRRVIRVFPALTVAALLAWVLVATGGYRIPGGHAAVGLQDFLLSSVLANFFVPGHAALVAVAWTLVIQVAIYAMVCALIPVYRRTPWLVIGIEIAVCAGVLAMVRNLHGLPISTVATIGAFGTAVVLGQVLWAMWTRGLPLWAGAGLGLGCWIVFLWGDALGYRRTGHSYPLTLFVALLIVLLALLAGDLIRPNRVVTWFASRSYSTYLLHQIVAFPVLAATQSWTRWPAGLLAVGCTFVMVEILYRTVERPAGRLAPALLARTKRARDDGGPPTTTPAGEPAASGAPG
ncbi:MAG: acyltransferase family protein [Pseudonocardiaceae bacterium]